MEYRWSYTKPHPKLWGPPGPRLQSNNGQTPEGSDQERLGEGW